MSKENTDPAIFLSDFGVTGLAAQLHQQEGELDVRTFPNKPFVTIDDPDFMFTTHIYTDEDNVLHMVTNDIALQLGSVVKKRMLVLACEGKNDFFLLSIPAVSQKNRKNSWVRSGQEALMKSAKKHVRVSKGMDSYRVSEVTKHFSKVQWPEASLEEIIKKTFAGKFISDLEHPIAAELFDQ